MKTILLFRHYLYLIKYHIVNRTITKKLINRFFYYYEKIHPTEIKNINNYDTVIEDTQINRSDNKISNKKYNLYEGPCKKIPDELINAYTLNNRVPILYKFQDNSVTKEIIWSETYLESYCKRFTPSNIFKNKHGKEPYPGASRLLCLSINKFNLSNKNIAIIGTQTPWIEAILINLRCKTIVTVEYNVPQYYGRKIQTLSYNDFCLSNKKYDAIITFSSIEHSGLGRYGENLDPSADIKTMNVIYEKLISKGKLFLGVPIGKDVLVWNMHRVYGEIRMPELIKKFHFIKSFGWDMSYLKKSSIQDYYRQPIIVLQKP